MKLSANEPTGIYAEPNEEITIDIKGTQSIQGFIGTRSYDENTEEFDLKPGKMLFHLQEAVFYIFII